MNETYRVCQEQNEYVRVFYTSSHTLLRQVLEVVANENIYIGNETFNQPNETTQIIWFQYWFWYHNRLPEPNQLRPFKIQEMLQTFLLILTETRPSNWHVNWAQNIWHEPPLPPRRKYAS